MRQVCLRICGRPVFTRCCARVAFVCSQGQSKPNFSLKLSQRHQVKINAIFGNFVKKNNVKEGEYEGKSGLF